MQKKKTSSPRIWVVSDSHFNHRNLERPDYRNRPPLFEEIIFANLVREVEEWDVLIHLGDVCIGKDQEMHERFIRPLDCRKVLIKGNHDKKSTEWYLTNGWDFVCDSLTYTKFGKKILLSHIPAIPRPGGFDFQVHGHTHGDAHRIEKGYDPTFHIEYAPETFQYSPVLLDTLLKRRL